MLITEASGWVHDMRPWSLPDGQRVHAAPPAANRDGWLAARRTLIGGSDIGALLDVSRYGDPLTLWAQKTGRVADDPPNLAMLRGQVFEAAVIELWANHVATFQIAIRRCGLVRSKRFPHVGATVDRLSVCDYSGEHARCIIEAKTVSDTREWEGEEVPVDFALQGGMQLLATGRDHVHFVGIGPRWQPLHRVLLRDEEFLTTLGERVETFWRDHIEADDPPQASAQSGDVLRRMYPESAPADPLVIDDDLAQHVHAANAASAEIAAAKLQLETATALIMQAMGTHDALVWPDGEIAATWRTGKTIDGATKDWRRAHPEIVERYKVPSWDFDVDKAIAENPSLLDSGGLRKRRTFSLK